KLLPVLSISFLLVALSLIVTGHRLGGPPLCYQSCGQCLSRWSEGVPVDKSYYTARESAETGSTSHSVSAVSRLLQSVTTVIAAATLAPTITTTPYDPVRIGCGYAN